MAITTAMVLTPQARPGGLASVVNPLPDGWTRGVDVLIGSVLSPELIGPCAVGSGEFQPPGEVERFVPAVISQFVHCSTLGRPDVAAYARAAVETTIWFALSGELVSGTATSNPSFATTNDIGDADSTVEAICLLEEELEEQLYGRLGVIHVPLGLACGLRDAVYRDGNRWRTLAGNLVAIHGTGNVVRGTGELWASWKIGDTVEYVNRSTNTTEARSDVEGMVVFDPAVILGVDVADPGGFGDPA